MSFKIPEKYKKYVEPLIMFVIGFFALLTFATPAYYFNGLENYRWLSMDYVINYDEYYPATGNQLLLGIPLAFVRVYYLVVGLVFMLTVVAHQFKVGPLQKGLERVPKFFKSYRKNGTLSLVFAIACSVLAAVSPVTVLGFGIVGQWFVAVGCLVQYKRGQKRRITFETKRKEREEAERLRKLQEEKEAPVREALKRGDAQLDAHQFDAAEASYAEALALAEQRQLPELVQQARERQASVARARQDLAEKRERVQVLINRGDGEAAAGNSKTARATYQQAIGLAKELRDGRLVSAIKDKIEPLEQREREQKAQQRSKMLKKALKLYEELPLEKLASLLDLESTVDLEKWLLGLPEGIPVKIRGEKVVVQEGADLTSAIDGLMDSYSKWEETKTGKRE